MLFFKKKFEYGTKIDFAGDFLINGVYKLFRQKKWRNIIRTLSDKFKKIAQILNTKDYKYLNGFN